MFTIQGTEPPAEEMGMDTEVLPSGSIDPGKLYRCVYPVLIQHQLQVLNHCTHKMFLCRHQHRSQLKTPQRPHQAPTANRTSLLTFHMECIYPSHPTLAVLNPDLPLTLVHLGSHVTIPTKRTSSHCKTRCKFYSSHKQLTDFVLLLI